MLISDQESILKSRPMARTGKEIIAGIEEKERSRFLSYLSKNAGKTFKHELFDDFEAAEAEGRRSRAQERLLNAYSNARETFLQIQGKAHQLQKAGDDAELSGMLTASIDRLNGLFLEQRQELLGAYNTLNQGGKS